MDRSGDFTLAEFEKRGKKNEIIYQKTCMVEFLVDVKTNCTKKHIPRFSIDQEELFLSSSKI